MSPGHFLGRQRKGVTQPLSQVPHPRCPGHSRPNPIPGKWNSLILFLDQDGIVGEEISAGFFFFFLFPSPWYQLDWQPGQRGAHSKCSLGSRMELITSNLPVASSSAL